MKTSFLILILMMTSLAHAQAHPKELEEYRNRYELAEQQAERTAQLLRETSSAGSTDKAEIQELRQRLEKHVEAAFQHRVQWQEQLLADAQAKLDASRQRLNQRKQIAAEIITRRVEDLRSGVDTSWRTALDAFDRQPIRNQDDSSQSDFAPDQPRDGLTPYRNFLWNQIGKLQQSRGSYLKSITVIEQAIIDISSEYLATGESTKESKQVKEQRERAHNERLKALEVQRDSIRQELDLVEKQIGVLREKLSQSLGGDSDPESIVGSVTAVTHSGKAKVNLGSDDGLTKGMRLNVVRDDRHIASLRLVELAADSSTGLIEPRVDASSDTPIRVGDQVVLQFDHAVLALIGRDPGESIYNDQLKRFKFRLEGINVADSAETGQKFWRRHYDLLKRDVIGVWGDPLTNSLIVVARPQAEQLIRELIAKDEAMSLTGFDAEREASLDSQLRVLKIAYEEALEEVAEQSLSLIDLKAHSPIEQETIAVAEKRLEAAEQSRSLIEEKLKTLQLAIQKRETLLPGTGLPSNDRNR